MSQLKDAAINLIRSLPDDCTLEDIHYHLYIREKVDRGIAAIDGGRVVPHEEAARRIAECAKSTGPSPP
jgi:predicted transcriptional regulator